VPHQHADADTSTHADKRAGFTLIEWYAETVNRSSERRGAEGAKRERNGD
jgi:hypothetical protein